jgi:hypothetical protein
MANNIQTKAVLFEHRCHIPSCAEWASFSIRPSENNMSQWSCWEHFPNKHKGKEVHIIPTAAEI